MFGFITKVPKIALIGLIILLIGFSPEILATFEYDMNPPAILGTYPNGSESSPTPLVLNSTITVRIDSDSPDVNIFNVYCLIWRSSDLSTTKLMLPGTTQGRFEASYLVEYGGKYEFTFHIEDKHPNAIERTTYAEVGDADGDFYVKDGNDPGWRMVTKDLTVRLNHYDTYFQFRPTKNAADITKVYIDVVGKTTFDMTKETSGYWQGFWRAPGDGTYTVNGYFRAFGREWQGLSILIGEGEDPQPSTPWSTYDWLKVIGGALIAVGLIWRK